MVQPKYSPEEALQRIKLMMEYDSSKTLDENKKVISEQTKDLSLMADADLMGNTSKIRGYFQTVGDLSILGFNAFDALGLNLGNVIGGRRTGVKGVVDALDGFVDSEDLLYVLTVIKTLEGKCYFDDVNNVKVPAINRFLELYQEDEDEDLIDEVNGVGTKTLPTGTDKVKQQIVKLIETLKSSQSCSVNKGGGGSGGGGNNNRTGGLKYKPCSGTYKYECKTSPEGPIGVVQRCLGFTGKAIDGKFGPDTKTALGAKGITSFTDADVNKICQSKPTVDEPEISGEAPSAIDGTSTDF
jgi:hypothetical protein